MYLKFGSISSLCYSPRKVITEQYCFDYLNYYGFQTKFLAGLCIIVLVPTLFFNLDIPSLSTLFNLLMYS